MSDSNALVFDRRDFLKLGATGLAIASTPALASCVRPPTHLPRLALGPNPANCKNQVLTMSADIPIKVGETESLLRTIQGKCGHGGLGGLWRLPTPGVHFARAHVLDAPRLPVDQDQFSIGTIHDQRIETAINFLTANAQTLNEVLLFCHDYEDGVAHDPVKLMKFLEPNLDDNRLFFTAYDTAEDEVQSMLAVQYNFFEMVRHASKAPDDQLRFIVDRFLVKRLHEGYMTDAPIPVVRPDHVAFAPHLTNTLSLVKPLRRGKVDPAKLVPCSQAPLAKIERFLGRAVTYEEAFRLIMEGSEFYVRDLHGHPLAQLPTLHFARIAVKDGNMVFASVYDGDFTQYILDFGSRIGPKIDLIWCLCEDYPLAGSRDVKGFISWMHEGQVDVQDFYSAHGNVTLIQMQKATKLRDALVEWTKRLPPDGKKLRAELHEFLRANQAILS